MVTVAPTIRLETDTSGVESFVMLSVLELPESELCINTGLSGVGIQYA